MSKILHKKIYILFNMMLRIGFRLLLITLILSSCSLSTEAAINPINISEAFGDSIPRINLREMIQECPGFISYPGYEGIIWLKQRTYQIDMSGSKSITTAWVILGRSEIEKEWLNWVIQIPKGGDAQIFEASLYDPGSLMQIVKFEPQRAEDEWRVNIQYVPEEFIFVLTYRQTYAQSLVIHDMLWLNESLPIWEQTILVNVETGRDFEYVTNSRTEPSVTSSRNHDVYKWMFVNQTPTLSRSLRTDSRLWLAFGNRQPLSNFIKSLENYAKMPVPTAPSNVETWLKKGDFESFFNWLQTQETDNSISRIRDRIPEKAPWSNWEKSIIASSWINRFSSGSCRLFWRLAVDPSQNNFANESIILGPAFELKRKNETFFYEIGQSYASGLTSLSLIGETLYAPTDGSRLEKRVIPPRKASDNRLSIIWNLNVAEDNNITGSISLIIRNSWKDFLMSDMKIIDIMREIAGRTAFLEDITTKNIKGGIEISAPLRPGKLILGASGTNAIISLNPIQPNWLRDMGMALTPYSLKFPLSIEANYKINLPGNVRDVLPPQQIDRDGGNIKYMEKYEYFKRRGRLEVTVRLTLTNPRIDSSMEQELAFALGRFGTQRSIPLRMR